MLNITMHARNITAYWVILLVLLTGCTTRITRSTDYDNISKYENVFTGEKFVIGFVIKEKTDDPNFLVDRPFKGLKMLAINIMIVNKSQETLVINRNDIALLSKDGSKYNPISKDKAALRAIGPLSMYGILFRKIAYGYHTFGFNEQIVLNPGEKKAGYVFYKVNSKDYDLIKKSDMQIMLRQIRQSDFSEYRFKLGEKK